MAKIPFHSISFELSSHFQPIYSLAHRRRVGLEAFLRATLKKRHIEPQAAFARFGSAKTRHQFDLQLMHLHLAHMPLSTQPQWLFLNIDSATLSRPEWIESLAHIPLTSGKGTHEIALEIPGYVLQSCAEKEIEAILALRKHGFLLAIDRFGMAYSNLERVCELEPDIVKFDQHVLHAVSSKPRLAHLLLRWVRLMHDSGALVVQQGVETEKDVLWALESGCDLIQGFYVASPSQEPDRDEQITRRIDKRWDEIMVQDLLKRKINRRQLELTRQAFVQSAILLMQNTSFNEAAEPLLSTPNVMRCFLLDSEGRQIGRNLNSPQQDKLSLQKFAPLADTTGAIWSRRPYFQHAIDHPGVLYMSEPYLSMTDTRTCMTLSMAIEIEETQHVLCADILLSGIRYQESGIR